MKHNIARLRGFTLVEIMIVVAIIGLLASMAIPNLLRSRETARMNACINNLRQIDGAKQQWALEFHQPDSVIPVASDVQPYLGRAMGGELPVCPADSSQSFTTSYSLQGLSTKPTCLVLSDKHVLP